MTASSQCCCTKESRLSTTTNKAKASLRRGVRQLEYIQPRKGRCGYRQGTKEKVCFHPYTQPGRGADFVCLCFLQRDPPLPGGRQESLTQQGGGQDVLSHTNPEDSLGGGRRGEAHCLTLIRKREAPNAGGIPTMTMDCVEGPPAGAGPHLLVPSQRVIRTASPPVPSPKLLFHTGTRRHPHLHAHAYTLPVTTGEGTLDWGFWGAEGGGCL